MRHLLPTLALIAVASAIPTAAHADVIDDFVMTTAYGTIAFSLPAHNIPTEYTYPSEFLFRTSATVNGVPGYQVSGFFYLPPNPPLSRSGLDIIVSPSITGPTGLEFNANGTYLATGTGADATFIPGTYHLIDARDPPFYFATLGGPYTLTISPETPVAITAEPPTLTFLVTGSLGLLSAIRRRTLVQTREPYLIALHRRLRPFHLAPELRAHVDQEQPFHSDQLQRDFGLERR